MAFIVIVKKSNILNGQHIALPATFNQVNIDTRSLFSMNRCDNDIL